MSKVTSKVSYTTKGYNSLKTTIPTAITQMMEILHGDTLVWDVEFVNGEKKITVKKL
ncbi:MAG TPA: hypothetical protein PLD00_07325 [Methanofastidiosum sp.]|jgi:hypothetical protein|nr:hypothetical protein [Methanofastidiosum sp.]HQC25921.1 hypothetical protein [Methanofastidiosum sp.]